MLICCLLIFFPKLHLGKLSEYQTVGSSFSPDQDVGPDLGPNCLQIISRQLRLPLEKETVNINKLYHIHL